MILPIYIYGNSILKEKSKNIDSNYPNLNKLILDMFDTMTAANGIGLAAPQIGLPINLFVIDLSPLSDEKKEFKNIKKVFINPVIKREYGDFWDYEEGCLSIPEINSLVSRKSNIEIEYYDKDFNLVREDLSGIEARVIQHEYDHLNGVLFTDYLSPKRKNILNRKIKEIKKGKFIKRYEVCLPNL